MKKMVIAVRNELLIIKENLNYRLPEEGEIELPATPESFDFEDYIAVDPDNEVFNHPVIQSEDTGKCVERWGLREAWKILPAKDYAACGKGVELLNWNREERFCGKDGTALDRHTAISKRCPVCGTEYFPRLSPAIVVLVKRGEEALLVHAKTLRSRVMALVAGFVETGESLEECVRREVKEETSLDIEDIRYYGSQSWPFPHQLMIGFTAKWKAGEIRFADGELTAGEFFSRDNVPEIPTMPSLSRMIIDAWIKGEI